MNQKSTRTAQASAKAAPRMTLSEMALSPNDQESFKNFRNPHQITTKRDGRLWCCTAQGPWPRRPQQGEINLEPRSAPPPSKRSRKQRYGGPATTQHGGQSSATRPRRLRAPNRPLQGPQTASPKPPSVEDCPPRAVPGVTLNSHLIS